MRLYTVMLILIACLLAGPAEAFHPFQPDFQNVTQVLDYAGALHKQELDDLKTMAEDTQFSTGIPLMLLTVPELKGWKPELYAAMVAKEMGVMDPARPGALFFVSAKERTGDIALGPGVQRWVRPEIVETIMTEEVFPSLLKGDVQAALVNGGWALSDALQGKYKTKAQKLREFLPLLIMLPVTLLFYFVFGDGKASRLNIFGGAWGRW